MAAPNLQSILATLAQYTQQNQSPAEQQRSTTPHAAPTRPIIDPATILTWQEGLRCVTKIAAQNREFEGQIRRLIRNQQAQEMRWYAERQKLKQKQATRVQSSADTLSILKSLTKSNDMTMPDTTKTNEEELVAFHQEIYRSQESLQQSMITELKALGVPFFGTPDALVRAVSNSEASTVQTSKQSITPKELLDLQRRMIRHLEDLYRD